MTTISPSTTKSIVTSFETTTAAAVPFTTPMSQETTANAFSTTNMSSVNLEQTTIAIITETTKAVTTMESKDIYLTKSQQDLDPDCCMYTIQYSLYCIVYTV